MISSLLTDLYQLTMAFGYWKLGIHNRDAVFHLIFRKQPFDGEYSIACGLATVVEFLQNWHFAEDDLAYLRTLKAQNGHELFSEEFLDYLRNLRFTCDVDAIPEGTPVFPHEPLLRITGPILQCQLLESTLLNIINFQTLVATKASRVCRAAKGDAVLEFGLRRAQGPDGALSASRAAYIGGCTATSNVLAGKKFGIPISGTHSHSWVTAFPDEKTAFSAWAEVMPHNCSLLVDTYNTIEGVKHAIETGKELRAQGSKLLGIRLDSGDMAELSIQARRMLDDAGFTDTNIIASNSLDEYVIQLFKESHSAINVWGVGTHLVTAYDHPALDGVYKLTALRDKNGAWDYKLKLSEQNIKTSNPGIHQVRRFSRDGKPLMDCIYDVTLGISETHPQMIAPGSSNEPIQPDDFDSAVDLLEPIMRHGQLVCETRSIHEIRADSLKQVENFLQTYQDTTYPVGLENQLEQMKNNLIADALKKNKRE